MWPKREAVGHLRRAGIVCRMRLHNQCILRPVQSQEEREHGKSQGVADGEERAGRFRRGVPGPQPVHLLREKEHAKVFFKHLEGGEAQITAGYPAGVIGDTLANLKAAAAGEKAEWSDLYPNFAQAAKDEGFKDIYNSFTQIAEVESAHERRYNILAARVEAGEVFKRASAIKWKCRNCGRVMEAAEAPKVCPACQHPQAYYEPFAENY